MTRLEGLEESSSDPHSIPADRLYDRAPCGLITTTEDGRIERANATLLAWTGYTQQELLGTHFAALLNPGDRIFYETRFLPLLQLQGEVREVVLGIRLADGSTMPALLNATLDRALDAASSSITVHHAILNISARHDYERQLLHARRAAEVSEARTRALQNATEAFGRSADIDALARALAESAAEALLATHAAVLLYDRPEPRLAGGTLPIDARLLPGVTAPAALTPESFSAISARDNNAEPRAVAALRSARLEILTAIPLVHEGRVTGTLVCFFARARDIDKAFIDLGRALAGQAAQSLARLTLQAQLEAIALYDPLTGLANRMLLRTRIADSVSPAAGEAQSLALIFIDLDDFKAINDELGHHAGDSVLRLIADRITSAVRCDDLVCRYGGDEFVVVCPATDAAGADAIAQRIQATIRQPLVHDDWQRTVTASIGVSIHSVRGPHPVSAEDLLRTADAAMYRSKQIGKDRTTIVTP